MTAQRPALAPGVAARVVAVAVTATAVLALGLAGCGTAAVEPTAAPAAPGVSPDPGEGSGAAGGGTMLPVSFSVGSAVAAVATALPPGTTVADLPADIGWGPDRSLEVPVERDGAQAVVVVVVGPPCTAASDLLAASEAATVAAAVCRAWEDDGRLPIVPADAGEGVADPQAVVR